MNNQFTLFKSVINGVESYFHFNSSTNTEIAKLALLDCLKWIHQVEDIEKAKQVAAQDPEGEPNIAPQEQSKVEQMNGEPSQ